MKRDRNDPEYTDELWRRWQRRRDLPFRQFDAAVEDLLTVIRESWVGRVAQVLDGVWVSPFRRLAGWVTARVNRL